MVNLPFLAAENQLLGGGITSKLASQCPSLGIYKHAPGPAFWRKRRLLFICIEKKVAKYGARGVA